MPQPYAWNKLQRLNGSVDPTARAGHTVLATKAGFVCYGGMDGRKDDKGRVTPNSDVYVLSLKESVYLFQRI